MSIFSSQRVPFLDNVPPKLLFQFLKAVEGHRS